MDILQDIYDRLSNQLADRIGLADEVREVLCSVRKEWAGERVYIAGRAEDARLETSARNRAIIRAHKQGERIPLLARRWGLSRQRVWKIING
jgi:Mor family transcriptional regulator